MVIRVEVPPEGYRVTLEKNDGEVCDTEHCAGVHDGLYDEYMPFVVGYPQEKEADGNL